MAYAAGRKEVINLTKTYIAGADLSSSANLFVKLNSSGQVILAEDGEEVKGVLLNSPLEGEAAEVALQNAGNIVRVRSGASNTAGGMCASSSTGKAINAAAEDIEVGFIDEAGGAEDEYAIIHLSRGGTVPA